MTDSFASGTITQWASSVIDFSSQQGATFGAAALAIGPPDAQNCDFTPFPTTSWVPGSADGTLEHITLGYDTPVTATGVSVREVCNAGFVFQIDVVDMTDTLHTVWTGVDAASGDSPQDFFVAFPETAFLVKGVRVHVDTDLASGYEQLDAVRLYGNVTTTCGNNIAEPGELCDGAADAACPGRCIAPGNVGDCTCATNLVTGFEPGEGFTPGFIHGQANWLALETSFNEAHIETENPAAGTQHLRIAHDFSATSTIGTCGFGATVGAFSPNVGELFPNRSTVSMDVSINTDGGGTYVVTGQSISEDLKSWEVEFHPDGSITPNFSRSELRVRWAPGVYNNLTVCHDPIAGRTDTYYDGRLIHRQTFDPLSNTSIGSRVEQVVVRKSGGEHPCGFADIDNLSILTGLSGSCIGSICGNNVVDAGESCDGTDDVLCEGQCTLDCTCPTSSCGNNVKDVLEACDGFDDAACPGLCIPPGDPSGRECGCPTGCGSGFRSENEFGEFLEVCDASAVDGDFHCPGRCGAADSPRPCLCTSDYATGFEPADGFATTDDVCGPGGIDGIAGWDSFAFLSSSSSHDSEPHIETANPASGTHHLRLDKIDDRPEGSCTNTRGPLCTNLLPTVVACTLGMDSVCDSSPGAGDGSCEVLLPTDCCATSADCDTEPGSGDGVCQLDRTCNTGNVGAACTTDLDCETSPGADDGECGFDVSAAFSGVRSPDGSGPSTTSIDIAISATGGADYFVSGVGFALGNLTFGDGNAVWRVQLASSGTIEVYDDPDGNGFFDWVDTGAAWSPGGYKTLTVCDDPVGGATSYSYDAAQIYTQVTRIQHGAGEPALLERVVLHSDNRQNGETADFDNLSVTTGLTGACTPSVCGNNLHEPGEECDGTSDANCPDQCGGDCTCPDGFDIGFEIAESYAAGPVEGQNGWTVEIPGDIEPHVETTNPGSGAQHLRFSRDPSFGDTDFSGTTAGLFPQPAGPTTTSMDVAISSVGGPIFQVFGRATGSSTANWAVTFDGDGTIQRGGSVFGAWTPGAYGQLVVCDDPLTGITDFYYDGALLERADLGTFSARVEQVRIVRGGNVTDHVGDFDNVKVEPGLVGICGVPLCGNGAIELAEVCDGANDDFCPGLCQSDCTCPAPVCANDITESGEQCDGTDDTTCPGQCLPDCTCAPLVCGNNVLDSNEECDGTDDTACPGACLPPGHAAECTCPGVLTVGFEAGEGFATGTIDGQLGWDVPGLCTAGANIGSPCATNAKCDTAPGSGDGVCTTPSSMTIDTVNPRASVQHLRVTTDSTFAAGTTLEAQSTDFGPFATGSSTIEVDMNIAFLSNVDHFFVTARSVSENAIVWSLRIQPEFAGLRFAKLEGDADGNPTGYVDLGVSASSGFTGAYFPLRVCDDPRSGQTSYYWAGGFQGAQFNHLTGTRVEQIMFGTNNRGGIIDFDNLTITRPIAPACHDCGNGFLEPGERCDDFTSPACPGACQVDCTCPAPVCGDGFVNRGDEQCDGADDSACPGFCDTNTCLCPVPGCGNGVLDADELCDSSLLGACADGCLSDCTCGDGELTFGCSDIVGAPIMVSGSAIVDNCPLFGSRGEDIWRIEITEAGRYSFTCGPDTCLFDRTLTLTTGYCDAGNVVAQAFSDAKGFAFPMECVMLNPGIYYLHIDQTFFGVPEYDIAIQCCECGNNIAKGPKPAAFAEQCDGTDDARCPGLCQVDCTCPAPFCGNGSAEFGEACDGADDAACPGACQADCTCPCPDQNTFYGCSEPPLTLSDTLTLEPGASDCRFTDGEEHIWEIDITEAGTYRFSACNSLPCPELLALTDSCCDASGFIVRARDGCPCGDEDCPALSGVALEPGTYYLHVGYAEVTSGSNVSYEIDIECTDATCGDGHIDDGETCDGADDAACPGLCQGDCTCPIDVCGNNVRENGERCDGTDAVDCPGLCIGDCTCPRPLCGNDMREALELCDGDDDSACPGLCLEDCTCACNDFAEAFGCGDLPQTLAGDLERAIDGCASGVFSAGVEDIWEINITEDGSYSFDMCSEAPEGRICASQTQLVLTTDCCNGNTLVAENESGCCEQAPFFGCFSKLECVFLSAGTYYLHVEHLGPGNSEREPGPYAVDVRCCGCGNQTSEPGEECDGADDLACPGNCTNDCDCAVCGDNLVEGLEECDGSDDTVCPGNCTNDCDCAVCGDSLTEGLEQCDGDDDVACPGLCLGDCTCPAPVCGNDIREAGEGCDGVSDAACPLRCDANCDCIDCDAAVPGPGEDCNSNITLDVCEAATPNIEGEFTVSNVFFGIDASPILATDKDGTWLATWDLHDQEVYASRSTDDGLNWSAPILVSVIQPVARTNRAPWVAADRNGSWVVVWESNDFAVGGGGAGGDFDIAFSRSTDNGQTWTAPGLVNSNATTVFVTDQNAVVVGDDSGVLVTAWESVDTLGGTIGTDSDILVSRSTDGGQTWSASTALNSNAATDSLADTLPRLTSGGGGIWGATWWSSIGLAFSKSTDGATTWSTPISVSGSAPTTSSDPSSLATDGQGQWVATFTSSFGASLDIAVTESVDDGSSWSAPRALNGNAATGTGSDRACTVSTNALGHWVAIWTSTDDLGGTIGTDEDVLASVRPPGSAFWSFPRSLNSDAATNFSDDDRSSTGLGTNGRGMWIGAWQADVRGAPGFEIQSARVLLELDCNVNRELDSCEIAGNPSLDANGDGILDQCIAGCGNGVIDAGETCDGNDDDACPGLCQPNCTCGAPIECGNGIVEAGEDCDDSGESATCDVDCTFATCGDDLTNVTAGETCDDAGESATCDVDCTFAACGDATINTTAGEDCDDGGESATCDADCTAAQCGDGTTNASAGEECDDAGESATCDVDCTFATCGDNLTNVTAGETCDGSDDAACPAQCQVSCTCPAGPKCGNNLIDAGEECDGNDDAACPGLCQPNCTCGAPIECGNGIVEAGEDCDDGGESATCDVDCTFAACGDATINTTAGETCDDGGESATCDADCTAAQCGDGATNVTTGEQCDDAGESATCDVDCTFATCGDNLTNVTAGETCDGADDAACPGQCQGDCACPPQADVIYVDANATGANVGTSWSDAFTDLQDALAAASSTTGRTVTGPGTQIWIAAGTYTPTPPAGSRSATFQLLSGVEIYGGFDGTETLLSQRDPAVNFVVLSGDLNADDGAVGTAENSYHVVNGSATDATARLDGVTVSAGNANGPFPDAEGGGMIVGRFGLSGRPTIAQCSFSNNASASNGGGVALLSGSNALLDNCRFESNVSGSRGGGVVVSNSSPTFSRCVFDANDAAEGGGAQVLSNGTTNFIDCVFRNNTARFGGAISCVFSAHTELINGLLNDNNSEDVGGGLLTADSGTAMATNCTFSRNDSGVLGGGMFIASNSSVTVVNGILWGNTAAGGALESQQVQVDGFFTVSYTLIEGLGFFSGNPGMLGVDPQFMDQGADNFRLPAGSPAIDAGDNAPVTVAADLDGNTRIVDGDDDTVATVDMGAYEWQLPECGDNVRQGAEVCDGTDDAACPGECILDCTCLSTCNVAGPASPERIGADESTKNRFLSFTAGDPGRSQAVRVRFDSLLPPFDLWNGAELWVGPPAAVSETAAQVAPGGGPTFAAARLQCMPNFMDWSTVGTVHVFHEGVVPGGDYLIDVIDAACDAGSAASYSAALPLATAVHGDTVTDLSVRPPPPPNGPPIDVTDALAILERFANAAGAIVKARADLEPGCLDLVINVSDVLMSLRGFSGLGYSFTPTAPDPCASTCINPLP